MRRSYLETVNQQLRAQRNCLLTFCFLLCCTGLFLSIFLFQKSEKVVVIPPLVEKEFWVDGRNVSSAYLEQYSYFLAQLLLGKSAYSAPNQRDVLLRHSAPEFVGILRKKLLDEEDMLKQQNASYTFYPISVKANSNTKQVRVEGERIFYVAGKQISSEQEVYLLSFTYKGGKLYLQGITSGEEKNA